MRSPPRVLRTPIEYNGRATPPHSHPWAYWPHQPANRAPSAMRPPPIRKSAPRKNLAAVFLSSTLNNFELRPKPVNTKQEPSTTTPTPASAGVVGQKKHFAQNHGECVVSLERNEETVPGLGRLLGDDAEVLIVAFSGSF